MSSFSKQLLLEISLTQDLGDIQGSYLTFSYLYCPPTWSLKFSPNPLRCFPSPLPPSRLISLSETLRGPLFLLQTSLSISAGFIFKKAGSDGTLHSPLSKYKSKFFHKCVPSQLCILISTTLCLSQQYGWGVSYLPGTLSLWSLYSHWTSYPHGPPPSPPTFLPNSVSKSFPSRIPGRWLQRQGIFLLFKSHKHVTSTFNFHFMLCFSRVAGCVQRMSLSLGQVLCLILLYGHSGHLRNICWLSK